MVASLITDMVTIIVEVAVLDIIWVVAALVEIKARISITRTKVSSQVTKDLRCRTTWVEVIMDLDSLKEMIVLRTNNSETSAITMVA